MILVWQIIVIHQIRQTFFPQNFPTIRYRNNYIMHRVVCIILYCIFYHYRWYQDIHHGNVTQWADCSEYSIQYYLMLNLINVDYCIRWIFGSNLIWWINLFWVISRFYIGECYRILHALGSKKENLAVFNLADFRNLSNC